jgi:acyl-lipid omega-6 desaturase (Delta-12 desaturase)
MTHTHREVLARFAQPSAPRALWQVANTLPPFLLLLAAMVGSRVAGWHYAWTLLIALPAAGFYVRLFIIQHDCGHGSFFANRRANRWLGACIGLLTLFPFGYWRKTHDVHHATSGDLDRRKLGDIRTLTVAEYRASSRWKRFCYRFYRSMPVMLGIGPIYQFVAKHRLPIGMPLSWRKEWRSVAINNVFIAAIITLLCVLGGWRMLFSVYLPVLVIAGAGGVWLFYVQHCYEDGYWQRHDSWDAQRAAIAGSSFYDLPPVLRWFTCNIGYHHVHHLAPRVPNYRLRAAHEACAPWSDVRRMTLRSSLACASVRLWDEKRGRMVGFGARARPAQ